MRAHILATIVGIGLLAAPAWGQAKPSWQVQPFEELGKSRAEVAAFNQDGSLLACVDKNVVTLWDMATGMKKGSVTLAASRKVAACLSFSPDSQFLVVTSCLASGKNEFVDLIDVGLVKNEPTPLDKKPVILALDHYLVGFFTPDSKKLHLFRTPVGEYLIVSFHYWDRATGKVVPTQKSVANIIASHGVPAAQGFRDIWAPRQDSFALNDAGSVFLIVNGVYTHWYDLTRPDNGDWQLFSSLGGFPGSHDMGAKEQFSFVSFAPRSVVALMGTTGGKIYLARGFGERPTWSADDRDFRSHAPAKGKQRNAILCMAITPDRKTMLSLSEDGKLCKRNKEAVLKKLEGPPLMPKRGTTIIEEKHLPAAPVEQVVKAPVYGSIAADCSKIVVLELDAQRVPHPRVLAPAAK